MNLFLLPDELWISILYEWIDEPTLLCAFDIALCNRLLRGQYLIWLQTRGTFNIFPNIHFETTLDHGKLGTSHQCVPAIFFDWCKKKQINPKSLSYCFEPTNERGKREWKVLRKASKAMKQIEQIKAYYRFDYNMIRTDLVSNVLNDCPKLKKLAVELSDGSRHYGNTLAFSCKMGPYPLVIVEFSRISIHLSSDSFRNFVDACPHLEKVKFDYSCKEIHLYDILYLLNHTNSLNSIDAYFSCDSHDMGNTQMSEIEKEAMGQINNTMRSLILRNFDDLEDIFNATCALTVFKKCPMLESTLHTFKVLRVKGEMDTASNENPFDYSDILNCFPALHTVDLMFTRTLYIVEPFASIPQVQEYKIWFDPLMPSPLPSEMTMKVFINLKKLTFQNMLLDTTD